jgi:hypothetical protein
MLGFKSYETAKNTICGIEIMHIVHKDMLKKFVMSFLEFDL